MEGSSEGISIPFHEGWSDFGTGALLNAVVLDGDLAEFDPEALHGRSRIESGIAFLNNPRGVQKGRKVPVAWVAMDPGPPPRYVGIAASHLLIDPEAGVGFKDLSSQSTQMIRAMRGKVDVSFLTEGERRTLKQALMGYSRELWDQAAPEFRQALE
ncbi:MAG: YwhD family protein [candidate division NC10 bacterium]|nr:YwhD family protein [candidate division NC10 bacterium]